MTQSCFWVAPISIGSSKTVKLCHVSILLPYSISTVHQDIIKEAEPVTIKLRGVMVERCKNGLMEKITGKKTNDLIVVSKYQFGKEPVIERLHFFEKKAELGWRGNFFDDIVFSTDGLKALSIKLQIQVYDIDKQDNDVKQSLLSLGNSVSSVLPILGIVAKGTAPAAFAAFQAANMVINLIDELNPNDKLIDQTLVLQSAQPETAHSLLQPGYFVCFSRNVDEELYLNSELRVVKSDGVTEYRDCDYAVLEVSRSFELNREQQLDQKAAKLMSELNGRGNSGKAGLDFLRETINGYDMYKTMGKIQQLTSREKTLASEKKELPPEQKQLLNHLKDKLRGDPVAKPWLGPE